MEPKKQTKVKGFTLIELVVVVAIFSIILFGAMQLIDPVSKIFNSTSNYETSAACVDNIKRYMEGSLRYADFVEVYEGGYIDAGDAAITEEKAIQAFTDKFFKNACETTDGTIDAVDYRNVNIYVMKIDNAANGKISKTTYKMNTKLRADGTYEEKASSTTEWAVNKAYYSSYDFNIALGANGVAADRTNFAMTITATRKHDSVSTATSASLALINIVNGRKITYDQLVYTGPDKSVSIANRSDLFAMHKKTTDPEDATYIVYAFEYEM